jgi:hypothetical protein
MSLLRRSLVAAAAFLALGATTSSAQLLNRPTELRVDLAAITVRDGNTELGVVLPGTLGIAVYLNDRIAIEPSVLLHFDRGDNFAGGEVGLSVAVPYYFEGDQGKSGLFAAPVIEVGKGFGDFLTDMTMDFGADVGIKREWKPNVGQRIALTLRTGDTTADEVAVGAVFGITLRWP